MSEQPLPAGIFELTAFVRLSRPGAPATIYIEGDGLAWLSKYTKSADPTPPDPLALRLAALDPAANVIYLARPCQYSGLNTHAPCPDRYWTTARTAPEVIAAYERALDSLKAEYRLPGFRLVGYSGGAAVAALLAAGRADILALRTVAGNLDYATFTRLHAISPLEGSRDPLTAAARLAAVPQWHFIGGRDEVVPAAIVESWRRAAGPDACLNVKTVAAADHATGWTAVWPALLQLPAPCPQTGN